MHEKCPCIKSETSRSSLVLTGQLSKGPHNTDLFDRKTEISNMKIFNGKIKAGVN